MHISYNETLGLPSREELLETFSGVGVTFVSQRQYEELTMPSQICEYIFKCVAGRAGYSCKLIVHVNWAAIDYEPISNTFEC